MAYLVKEQLYSILYPEIIKKITRDYEKDFANLAAFPATGVAGLWYKANDNGKKYIWNVDAYEEATQQDIIAENITTAISQAKSYLSRFNLNKLFKDDDPDFVNDPILLRHVKSIACWYVIQLGNPQVDYEKLRAAYDDAVAWLKDVQSGKADPQWPLKEDDASTDRVEGTAVSVTSNTKRNNYF